MYQESEADSEGGYMREVLSFVDEDTEGLGSEMEMPEFFDFSPMEDDEGEEEVFADAVDEEIGDETITEVEMLEEKEVSELLRSDSPEHISTPTQDPASSPPANPTSYEDEDSDVGKQELAVEEGDPSLAERETSPVASSPGEVTRPESPNLPHSSAQALPISTIESIACDNEEEELESKDAEVEVEQLEEADASLVEHATAEVPQLLPQVLESTSSESTNFESDLPDRPVSTPPLELNASDVVQEEVETVAQELESEEVESGNGSPALVASLQPVDVRDQSSETINDVEPTPPADLVANDIPVPLIQSPSTLEASAIAPPSSPKLSSPLGETFPPLDEITDTPVEATASPPPPPAATDLISNSVVSTLEPTPACTSEVEVGTLQISLPVDETTLPSNQAAPTTPPPMEVEHIRTLTIEGAEISPNLSPHPEVEQIPTQAGVEKDDDFDVLLKYDFTRQQTPSEKEIEVDTTLEISDTLEVQKREQSATLVSPKGRSSNISGSPVRHVSFAPLPSPQKLIVASTSQLASPLPESSDSEGEDPLSIQASPQQRRSPAKSRSPVASDTSFNSADFDQSPAVLFDTIFRHSSPAGEDGSPVKSAKSKGKGRAVFPEPESDSGVEEEGLEREAEFDREEEEEGREEEETERVDDRDDNFDFGGGGSSDESITLASPPPVLHKVKKRKASIQSHDLGGPPRKIAKGKATTASTPAVASAAFSSKSNRNNREGSSSTPVPRRRSSQVVAQDIGTPSSSGRPTRARKSAASWWEIPKALQSLSTLKKRPVSVEPAGERQEENDEGEEDSQDEIVEPRPAKRQRRAPKLGTKISTGKKKPATEETPVKETVRKLHKSKPTTLANDKLPLRFRKGKEWENLIEVTPKEDLYNFSD
ncbi:hypothetical protein P7C70_g3702, partial [Phenoliferia sp. Uapishka_3]